MKWYEYIGIILAFGGLTQLISWILEALGLKEILGSELIFFLSALFSLLIILILIIIEIQKDIEKIKMYLNKQGYIEYSKEEPLDKLITNMKNKKGAIDSKILLVIVILIILYLLFKAGVFNLS